MFSFGFDYYVDFSFHLDYDVDFTLYTTTSTLVLQFQRQFWCQPLFRIRFEQNSMWNIPSFEWKKNGVPEKNQPKDPGAYLKNAQPKKPHTFIRIRRKYEQTCMGLKQFITKILTQILNIANWVHLTECPWKLIVHCKEGAHTRITKTTEMFTARVKKRSLKRW